MDHDLTPTPICTLADGRIVLARDTRDLSLGELQIERDSALAACDELAGDERHACANIWLGILDDTLAHLENIRAQVEISRLRQLDDLAERRHLHALALAQLDDAAEELVAASVETIADCDRLAASIAAGEKILRATHVSTT